MALVVTGPEGSGTRWLAALCRSYLGIEPEHRPMPNHDSFWDWKADPEGTRYVVIQRRPDVVQLSLLAQHARWEGEDVRPLRPDWATSREWWHRAIEALAHVPGAYWMSYEAMVVDARIQMQALAAWLGVEPVGPLIPTEDGNRKWLTFLER